MPVAIGIHYAQRGGEAVAHVSMFFEHLRFGVAFVITGPPQQFTVKGIHHIQGVADGFFRQ